jgi:hypothetical protein
VRVWCEVHGADGRGGRVPHTCRKCDGGVRCTARPHICAAQSAVPRCICQPACLADLLTSPSCLPANTRSSAHTHHTLWQTHEIPDGCVHSALLTLHRRCCPSLRRRRRVQLRQTAVQRIKHSNTERALLSIRQQTPNVSAVSTIQAPLSLCMLCGAARTAAVRSEFTKAFTKAWTTGAVPARALPSCVCVAHGLFRYCTALSK